MGISIDVGPIESTIGTGVESGSQTLDPTGAVPYTGQPPNDPFSPKCIALAKKIKNIKDDIAKREQELIDDPMSLPEWLPPSVTNGLLRLDKRGHRKIIRKLDSVLRKLEDQYDDECRCKA